MVKLTSQAMSNRVQCSMHAEESMQETSHGHEDQRL